MKIIKGAFVGIVFLIAGFALSLFMHKWGWLSTPSTVAVVQVEQPREELAAVQGIGYIEPVSEVRNLSFKTGGVIARCPVQIGQQLSTNEVIASLDDSNQLNELAVASREVELADAECKNVLAGPNKFAIEAAKKAIDAARAQLKYDEVDFRRNTELLSTGVVSHETYDLSDSNHSAALAKVQESEAELQRLENYVTPEQKGVAEAKVRVALSQRELAAQHVKDMKLCAPCNGTVLEVFKREGEAVSPTFPDPVVLFGNTSQLQIRAEIDERFAHFVKVGQVAVVSGRGLGEKSYKGRVTTVKMVMGKKTVFLRSSTERKDLDVLQVFIQIEDELVAPIGLRVDVAIPVDGNQVNGVGPHEPHVPPAQ